MYGLLMSLSLFTSGTTASPFVAPEPFVPGVAIQESRGRGETQRPGADAKPQRTEKEEAVRKQREEAARKAREQDASDVEARRRAAAKEAERRKQAGEGADPTAAEKVARERAAAEARARQAEEERVQRERAAHTATLDAAAIRLVKANELKFRSRMARLDKLTAIYEANGAQAKLQQVETLREREGVRYRKRVIELQGELGKVTVERILDHLKNPAPTPEQEPASRDEKTPAPAKDAKERAGERPGGTKDAKDAKDTKRGG